MASRNGAGRSIAIVGGGFGGVGAAVMLRRAGYDDVTVFERASGSAASGTTTPIRAPPATSRRTSTSSPSRPTRAGRGASRRRPRSRPTSRTSRARYGVLDRVRTGTEVQRASWDEERGRWLLETSAGPHEADVLVTACGQLSVPKRPAAPRPRRLRGPAFHTAAVAPRRRPRRQARRRGRHRLQRDPGRARDPARGRPARRLPALARLDPAEDGLRLLAAGASGCSSASRSCSASTARRSSPSWSSAPRR